MSHYELAHRMMENINNQLIGKEEVVRLTVTTLLARGHLLLEDVPGVGKTTLAKALANTISSSFGRIQFTPDTLPSDVTGISIYHMPSGEFRYMDGPVMNHVVLADEINRTSPKTQASLLEVMEEGQVTVDGNTHVLPNPFIVIATQNPIEFIGTYHLPEAQLDRFLIKLSIGYPSPQEELRMGECFLKGELVSQRANRNPTKNASKTNENASNNAKPITNSDVEALQWEVSEVTVHKDVLNYIINIINQTRNNELCALGASPRATLALMRASQANAYLEGRNYVLPDDVQTMAAHVLAHRLVLSVEARVGKRSTTQIIESILKNVHVPVL